MTEKILSFILSVTLLAGLFTVRVSAEESDGRLSDAAGILHHLGIIEESDTFDTDKPVTRGHFAVLLAKMIKADTDTSDNILYPDIADENERKAVLALSSLGIINGYEDGSFRPDENISVNQMVMVAVRTLGYKYLANASDYSGVASREKLTRNIKVTGDASMSDCIVLLYNTLHAKTAVNTITGGEQYLGKTIIETYYGLWYIKGRITANEYTGFVGGATNSPDAIRIDGNMYHTRNEEIGSFLGYDVTAYYDTDSEEIVYYILDNDTETVKISSDEFDSFDGKKINYTLENGKRKNVKLEDNVVILKNSRLVETDYEGAFNMEFGTIECMCRDGKYDMVVISSYRNYKVKSVDIGNKILYTDKKDSDGNAIKIGLDGKEYVKFVMIPSGKEVNESTIQPDDIISVSMSDDGNIIRGYVCTERITGKIERISRDDGITLNGIEYKIDPEFYDSSSVAIGDTGTFILDFSGRVAGFLNYKPKGGSIGYVYKVVYDEDYDLIKLRIFNTSGEHIYAVLAEKVKLDGNTKKPTEVKDALCTADGGALRCQLIMYGMNDEGQINSVDIAAESEDKREKDGTLYTLLNKGAHFWYYQMKSFDRKYVLSGNTYYMRVPNTTSDEVNTTLFGCQRFSAVTWYNQTKTINILGLYKFDDEQPYADVLLVGNSDGASLTNQTEITVVSSVREECVDDESVTAIHGYRRGAEVTAYVEEGEYRDDVEAGDLIRFVNRVDGYVGSYEVVFDYSEDDVRWAMTSTSDNYSSKTQSVGDGLRYVLGYVNKLYISPYTEGLNSVIEIGAVPGQTDDIYQIDASSASTTRFIVVDKNRRKNSVYMGHLDEIIPFESSKSLTDTSRVFVHARSGWVVAVIIYK